MLFQNYCEEHRQFKQIIGLFKTFDNYLSFQQYLEASIQTFPRSLLVGHPVYTMFRNTLYFGVVPTIPYTLSNLLIQNGVEIKFMYPIC